MSVMRERAKKKYWVYVRKVRRDRYMSIRCGTKSDQV